MKIKLKDFQIQSKIDSSFTLFKCIFFVTFEGRSSSFERRTLHTPTRTGVELVT